MTTKKEKIAYEYKEFWELANNLANEDAEKYPLDEKEPKRHRMEKHLIGMLEMYQVKYGSPEERLRIVEFLEKQLFRIPPVKDETSHLTFDMWQDIKKSILKGEYINYLDKESV